MPASSTGTASRQLTTTPCTRLKKAAARFVESLQKQGILRGTGRTSSPLTIATTLEKYEDCYATTATQESDTLAMSRWHYPPRGISDFTLDEIVSIEYDGEEEVFDVQVDTTENFIANGLVSHNTWWNEDDWAGRIQQVMASGEGDRFEIIKYPAINEDGDEYLLPDDSIVQILPGSDIPAGAKMTRPHNTAIHPARYTTEAMLRIKRNLAATGQKRVWNALYQQDPVPDEGDYFKRENLSEYDTPPSDLRIYGASDYAVTEGAGDYTEHGICATDQNMNLYVLDWWYGQTQADTWIEKQCDLILMHRPLIWFGEAGPIRRAIEYTIMTVLIPSISCSMPGVNCNAPLGAV